MNRQEVKFSEMEYRRLLSAEVMNRHEELLNRFENAVSFDAAYQVYRELDSFQEHVQTMMSIAYIRNSIDTTDGFYSAEKDYYDSESPLWMESFQKANKLLLSSPYRSRLEEELGKLLFINAEINLKTFSPEIVPELQIENKLTTDYDKLIASAQIEYDGKTLTLAQLTPYHESCNRAVRRSSLEARAAWFTQNGADLDRIFDELVKVRTSIANKLGYKDFIELGYYRMQRNCYNAKDVAEFRKAVLEHLVPIAVLMKKEQAERIGVKELQIYDDAAYFKDGNANPVGGSEEIFEVGRRMYHELSPETGNFIDMMLERDLFDVLTRKGKSGGGYCADLPDYGAPFIFANFNGTAGDIDVLTHEAGHAFASYMARDIYPSDSRHPTLEACEVHSMSMEFLTWPWMDSFFRHQTKKYKITHLSSSVTFIPYGTMVDYFQHIVYENPHMTPAERNAKWLELEKQFRPWLNMEDFPFYGEGRRWQMQAHIYQLPFYYIDYCLAQTVALEFWALSQLDYKEAWNRYLNFVKLAGTKTFKGLIEASGMETPFGGAALLKVAEGVLNWLSDNTSSLK